MGIAIGIIILVLPAFLVLGTLERSIALFLRARRDPLLFPFVSMGILLAIAILLFWYYPIVLRLTSLSPSHTLELAIHAVQDVCLLLGLHIFDATSIDIAYGPGTPAARRGHWRMRLVLGVVFALMAGALWQAVQLGEWETSEHLLPDPGGDYWLVSTAWWPMSTLW